MRIEVACKPHLTDGRAKKLQRTLARRIPSGIEGLKIVDVFLVKGGSVSTGLLAELFLDPVAQKMGIDSPVLGKEFSTPSGEWDFAVEVVYRPGVTDPVANTAKDAIRAAGSVRREETLEVRSALQYVFRAPTLSKDDQAAIANALHNPLIQQVQIIDRQQWLRGTRFPVWYPATVAPSPDTVSVYDLSTFSDEALVGLSRSRLLALNLAEMRAIKDYISNPAVKQERRKFGLGGSMTDVEIEMIAQTWSEHCKHKIFNAEITYRDDSSPFAEHHSDRAPESGTHESPQIISSLFSTYIRATTEKLTESRPFLKSVFHDNSGVIAFDEDHLVCFKVETHNSPSALDPYGGAITGIVGVNRDILGTGKCAKPIFNTDVLCFGYTDMLPDQIPEGLLHPARIMDGVHHGIIDGGNQSGIPVVAGGFLFDDSFVGKPLVFCGTGGILPAWVGDEEGWVKHVAVGDFAVMVGGRIGKDGIHGATFSSQPLDATSPTSAVQIGDPITQRKMSDFLLEARDQQLFRGITDNGAGGLSSSLGEMAEEPGGLHVNLDACPLKYPGLAAWEILVSESQERMSLAVDPEKVEELLDLARRRDVEAVVIGQFTDTGYIDIDYHGRPACHLSLDFLHHGLPVMKLNAVWKTPPGHVHADASSFSQSVERSAGDMRVSAEHGKSFDSAQDTNLTSLLLAVLADPNVASKEPLVRQYDHEVKGYSVVKPMSGEQDDGVTDGAVIKPLYGSNRGLSVTHGICPRYGDFDTYQMALNAVDEAFRSHVVLGGDPARAAALDNFCWPDPVQSDETPDGTYKLAQLVRACQGLQDACLAYGLPLVSGKDSMKNDAHIGGKKVSVRPTLLVSLFGIVEDVRKSITADFKSAGSILYVAGLTRAELGGSTVQQVIERKFQAGEVLSLAAIGVEIEDEAFRAVPRVDLQRAASLYRAVAEAIDQKLVRSAHDLSDGGLAIAVAESAIGGRLGAEVDLSLLPAEGSTNDFVRLFSESPSRFLIEVEASDCDRFEHLLDGRLLHRVGKVTARPIVRFRSADQAHELPVAEASIDELISAWKVES